MLSLLLGLIAKFFEIIDSYIYRFRCHLQGITKHAEVLITGTPDSGKTSLAHKLREDSGRGQIRWRPGSIATTAHLDYNKTRFTFFEPGGLAAPPIFGFLRSANGIIFMVDGKNYDKFMEARIMLDLLLERDEIRGVPVAIFMNKIDSPLVPHPEEFLELMGFHNGELDRIRKERAIEVFFGTVIMGQGVQEVIRWLEEHV
ncbi:ADP-ribosylation factor family-domain-containing protein [Aspergillus granulosus]|uniref:ADP-ribosylation factor family-domain-containing protein n=1 Tax=Aspergillus granulosus TaxID=176169 RepID=A0ABR4I0D1_9EURO